MQFILYARSTELKRTGALTCRSKLQRRL